MAETARAVTQHGDTGAKPGYSLAIGYTAFWVWAYSCLRFMFKMLVVPDGPVPLETAGAMGAVAGFVLLAAVCYFLESRGHRLFDAHGPSLARAALGVMAAAFMAILYLSLTPHSSALHVTWVVVVVSGVAIGACTCVATVLWTSTVLRLEARTSYRFTLACCLAGFATLFLFSFLGPVKLFLSLAVLIVCFLHHAFSQSDEPVEPDEVGRVGIQALSGYAKAFAGLALISAISGFQWQLEANRGLYLSAPSVFGGLDAGSLLYFITCVAALAFVYMALRFMWERMHVRTIHIGAFLLVGLAFFVPGFLGVGSYAASAIFSTLTIYLCFLTRPSLRSAAASQGTVAPAVVAGVIMLVTALLGVVFAHAVFGTAVPDGAVAESLTALTVYAVMVAPFFLFRSQGSVQAVEDGSKQLDARAQLFRTLAAEYALTQREVEILDLARRGYSASAIGETLYISQNTVKVHLRHLYGKLQVSGKQELIEFIENKASSRGLS